MRIIAIPLVALAIFLIGAPPSANARTSATPPPTSPDFSCTGTVHAQAIGLWEHALRGYYGNQISSGLNKEGNVYVLYNTQEELQPFVEMTRRCKDRQQIAELVDALSPVFASLRPLPDAPGTRGWVCTGGSTCTPANHLLGKEVQLCSAQFLGLLGAVATDIVETIPTSQRTAAEKAFVVNAATAMATQVDNWLSPTYFKSVAARTRMTSADAKDGQSTYFFQDRDLWFMTILSDLAELHETGVKMEGAGRQAFQSLQTKHSQIAGIFNLFLTRITLFNTSGDQRAEIDRGYWRNYADSKYAAYNALTSPVSCHQNIFGVMQKTYRVKSKAAYVDSSIGWDLSHARRLVPALASFVRNRTNLTKVFDYSNPSFNPSKLQRAFANQIVDKVWNKDRQHPLFSNFWDGSNGWYRAGYSNGTDQCRPGQAPYSLAWSYPTGGYPQWGEFNETLRSLNLQIYRLLDGADTKKSTFVDKYYSRLQMPKTPDAAQEIWSLTFLSSLVGN
ncbi:hypothetical protein [Rhodanobacter glycinis]|uniref:hypothetical protein n=1 Tax=Rhodanobacter glycinis TaxID=582702 RepID=UPI00111409CD|nr:hypothetical protein [Rhodanobacter glycinis]